MSLTRAVGVHRSCATCGGIGYKDGYCTAQLAPAVASRWSSSADAAADCGTERSSTTTREDEIGQELVDAALRVMRRSNSSREINHAIGPPAFPGSQAVAGPAGAAGDLVRVAHGDRLAASAA
jgi:hypothetical protein